MTVVMEDKMLVTVIEEVQMVSKADTISFSRLFLNQTKRFKDMHI